MALAAIRKKQTRLWIRPLIDSSQSGLQFIIDGALGQQISEIPPKENVRKNPVKELKLRMLLKGFGTA